MGDEYLKKGKISEYMKIINSQDGEDKNTPLMHACKNGHYDVVKQLIEADASRWIRKKKNVSKLHAFYDGNNDDGVWTNAFYMAMMNGHIKIATDFFMKYQKNEDDSVSMGDSLSDGSSSHPWGKFPLWCGRPSTRHSA